MKKNISKYFLFALVALSFSSCYYDNEEELYPSVITCDTITVTYSNSVAPILTSSCNGCHSSASPSGGVILDSYSQASVYALNGKLYGVVSHTSGSPMPKGGSKIDNCSIAKIKKWAAAGAPNN
ncbi:MAG: hypothetical protein ACK48W_13315 [Bacteroidota bacterium]